MKFTTLDKVIRRNLLAKRQPLHYYIEYLVHASTCLRELTFDSLKIINTVELTLNDYYAADLPCDYIDFTKVGIRVGQFIQPITQRDSINRLRNQDSQGAYVPYQQTNTINLDFPFWPGFWMFQNVDDLGENTGRFYGWNPGLVEDGFKIIKERNQIQFQQSARVGTYVMEYISDGQTSDNASQVEQYAWSAIEAYINWKRTPNADNDHAPEAYNYKNQRRLLRARMSELTLYDLRQILFRNYRASIKE
jgi:hypothetical protein